MDSGRFAIVVWPAAIGRLVPAAVSRLLALLLTAVVLATPGAVRAETQDDDLFQVNGIRVDETDQTAAAARMKALAAGERRAWEVLVNRLVDPAQRARMAALPNVGDAVKDFSVIDEKVSAVRYIATLNYTFRPDAVKRLLGGRSARFAVTRSKPVLVVPVLAAAPAGPPGDAGATWREAWRTAARNRGLVPLRIAPADSSDAGLTGTDPGGVDRSRLADLARRSDAENAVLTLATITAAADGGNRLLKVSSTRYPATGPGQPLPDKTLPLGAPENDAAVFNDAAAAVAQDIETIWRRGNAVSTKAVSATTVQVQTLTIEDWVAMRRRLNELPQVERVQVVAVGREYATVVISYPGGADDLAAAMAKKGLAMRNDGGQWKVVDAASLPPSEEPPPTDDAWSTAPPPAEAEPVQ